MTFKEVNGEGLAKIALPVGSLVTLAGDARYKWTHAIEKTDSKWIDKDIPRISITFRHVKLKYQGKSAGSQISPASPTSPVAE